MCGIAGFSWCDKHLVKRMSDAIRHRGPDDEGAFTNSELSFGHRRLSILDLSQLGRQPMTYEREGRSAVVTFNGEIYNFHDIRHELEDRGYRFNTGTDTEVIPAAYLEWGLECVERFNGMWAFALYDSTRKQIVLSRDRFGEKPLYYRLQDRKLIFASEIKAILVHPIPRRANLKVVADYLFWGTANQGIETFFQDIWMLPPAHNAIFDLQTGRLALHKYYEPQPGNRRVTADEFHNALRKSVSSRLISDVPISVSLSSGIDSTSVAALTAKSTTNSVKAFTTATDQSLGDETRLIRQFLEQYPQFELEKASLSEASFCKHYREIIFHMDEPFARQSAYVRWEIANLTRQHDRKVLLNGEGADEILGGYMAFAPHFLVYLARRFMLIRFSREVYATLRHPERRNLIEAFRSGVLFNSSYLTQQDAAAAAALKGKFHIRVEPIQRTYHRFMDIKDYLARLVCETSLPRLLNCNDKMTMANSVEARAPFLDHEFVNLAFSMDPSQLVVNGCRKYPLRQAMRGHVPDEILFRKNKDTFNAPIFDYLGSEPIRHRVKEIFADARTCMVFNPKAYLGEYERYLSRRGTNRAFLLHGLFLEEWANIFEVDFG
jgi:asparagine synthase (glutamine-hydrolysing)